MDNKIFFIKQNVLKIYEANGNIIFNLLACFVDNNEIIPFSIGLYLIIKLGSH